MTSTRVFLVVVTLFLLSGCAEGDRHSRAPGVLEPPHEVFKVGTDLRPGVYTARSYCSAVAASSAEYDLMDVDGTDDDTWLRGSMVVGDLMRIEVRRGEFLHTYGCDWNREEGEPRTPDPATLAGRCAILDGADHLAEKALSYAGKPIPESEAAQVGVLQDRLTTVGFQMGKRLSHLAGVLIDLLDDPVYYSRGSRIRTEAERAVAEIRRVCNSH